MNIYKNLSGNSGVLAYEIKQDAIIVEFKTGECRYYEYNCTSAGTQNIEEMKKLAVIGRGLNTFIKKYINKNYSRKW